MINPGLDVWVWLSAVGLLIVLGVRAWTVETGDMRTGATKTRARVLTAVCGVFAVVLVGFVMHQGGSLLVTSVVDRTDPLTGLPLAGDPAAPAGAANPANPADPAAPAGAADPAAGNGAAPANPAAPGP